MVKHTVDNGGQHPAAAPAAGPSTAVPQSAAALERLMRRREQRRQSMRRFRLKKKLRAQAAHANNQAVPAQAVVVPWATGSEPISSGTTACKTDAHSLDLQPASLPATSPAPVVFRAPAAAAAAAGCAPPSMMLNIYSAGKATPPVAPAYQRRVQLQHFGGSTAAATAVSAHMAAASAPAASPITDASAFRIQQDSPPLVAPTPSYMQDHTLRIQASMAAQAAAAQSAAFAQSAAYAQSAALVQSAAAQFAAMQSAAQRGASISEYLEYLSQHTVMTVWGPIPKPNFMGGWMSL